MPAEELYHIINQPNNFLFVLYHNNAEAGYAEIVSYGDYTELAYFGLIPDFIGRGLGQFLMSAAIDTAWSRQIDRLWVHTNTLDHPRALPLYQQMGFTPYAQERTTIVPID